MIAFPLSLTVKFGPTDTVVVAKSSCSVTCNDGKNKASIPLMHCSILDAGSGISILVVVLFAFDLIVALAAVGSGRQLPFESATCTRTTSRTCCYGSPSSSSIFHRYRSIPKQSTSLRRRMSYSTNSSNDYVEVTDDNGLKSLVSKIDSEDGNVYQFVRLEKEPNEITLNDISSSKSILGKVMDAECELKRYGRADMYIREWEENHEESNSTDMEYSSSSDITFTALQFNTLAEGLSSCPNKCPFCTDKNERDERISTGFGGFTSIPHPSIVLDFELRKWRLLEIILGRELNTPYDIIAMEEVDRYHGFFGPVLQKYGYDCIFTPKKNSPSARLGWYSDGCVLAWKVTTFNLLHKTIGDYTVGNQVFIVATLQHRTSNQKIVVAVTHLKAQQSEPNEAIRCRQIDELLLAIDSEIRFVKKGYESDDVQVLVLGDFNADPPSQTNFDTSAIQRLLTHKIPFSDRLYRSTYKIDDVSDDNTYTTWKIRGTKVSKRFIDYIFYAGSSIRCIATLKIVNSNEIESTRLPGLRHPSDHLHIAAKFKIN